MEKETSELNNDYVHNATDEDEKNISVRIVDQLSVNEDKKVIIWSLRCDRSLMMPFVIHLLDVTTDIGTYNA